MHKLQNTDNRIFQDFNFDNRSLLVKNYVDYKENNGKTCFCKTNMALFHFLF